jgi:hypothetical protein
MAKLEVTKSIEARMLNKRNRQTLAQPPVTIPFGAILSDVVEARDVIEFNYLGELYNCKTEVLRAASHSLDGEPAATASAGVTAVSAAPVAVTFVWEKLNAGNISTSRAKLPGGWLIAIGDSAAKSVTFYPDPNHEWDGKTL